MLSVFKVGYLIFAGIFVGIYSLIRTCSLALTNGNQRILTECFDILREKFNDLCNWAENK